MTVALNYVREELENLMRTNRQTDRQTDREFNYRGHSYPLWIVGVSGPIMAYFIMFHLYYPSSSRYIGAKYLFYLRRVPRCIGI